LIGTSYENEQKLMVQQYSTWPTDEHDETIDTLDPNDLDDEFDPEKRPVDNELQVLIPLLLRAILGVAWAARMDWFFGANLGLYSQPGESPLGPDGFLSLGVSRFQLNGKLRVSYVVWHENNVMPQWVLEIVSKKPGGEYGSKFREYARLGVLYYTVYNPDHWRRDRHDSFEVYKLVEGVYVRHKAATPFGSPKLGWALVMSWVLTMDSSATGSTGTISRAIASLHQRISFNRSGSCASKPNNRQSPLNNSSPSCSIASNREASIQILYDPA
jgi:Uma2 family endonuclease